MSSALATPNPCQDVATSAYESDFLAWALEQARLIRAGRLDLVDLENVAEEIESVGRSERRELYSRTRTIIEHLLKLAVSRTSEPREDGWRPSSGAARKSPTFSASAQAFVPT